MEFNKVQDNQNTICIALPALTFCRKTSIQNSFVQRTYNNNNHNHNDNHNQKKS